MRGLQIGLGRLDRLNGNLILGHGGIQIALAHGFFLRKRLDPVQVCFVCRLNRFGAGNTAHLGRHIRLELLAFQRVEQRPLRDLGPFLKMDALQIAFHPGRNGNILETVYLSHEFLENRHITGYRLINSHFLGR